MIYHVYHNLRERFASAFTQTLIFSYMKLSATFMDNVVFANEINKTQPDCNN